MGTVHPRQAYQRLVEGLFEPGGATMSRPADSHADTTAAAAHSTRTDTGAATADHDPEYERAHLWRDATRELVLAGATAMAAADQPQSRGSISITLTGKAQSIDLLLADTGNIALTSLGDHVDVRSHSMRVVPMRLDMLSDLPAIRVLGRGVTEPTQLRLVVELTARNPHTTPCG
jgi:hypothetical protein